MLKSEELQKHDLLYGRDFLGIQRGGNIDERVYNWKSRNGTLSAEDVQDLVVSNDFCPGSSVPKLADSLKL